MMWSILPVTHTHTHTHITSSQNDWLQHIDLCNLTTGNCLVLLFLVFFFISVSVCLFSSCDVWSTRYLLFLGGCVCVCMPKCVCSLPYSRTFTCKCWWLWQHCSSSPLLIITYTLIRQPSSAHLLSLFSSSPTLDYLHCGMLLQSFHLPAETLCFQLPIPTKLVCANSNLLIIHTVSQPIYS